MYENGERAASRVRERLLETISSERLAKLDYAEIVNPGSLEPVDRIDGEALVALAVTIGKTRLIDNLILGLMGDKE
jgi:pantoate--beta-alanine ligase